MFRRKQRPASQRCGCASRCCEQNDRPAVSELTLEECEERLVQVGAEIAEARETLRSHELYIEDYCGRELRTLQPQVTQMEAEHRSLLDRLPHATDAETAQLTEQLVSTARRLLPAREQTRHLQEKIDELRRDNVVPYEQLIERLTVELNQVLRRLRTRDGETASSQAALPSAEMPALPTVQEDEMDEMLAQMLADGQQQPGKAELVSH